MGNERLPVEKGERRPVVRRLRVPWFFAAEARLRLGFDVTKKPALFEAGTGRSVGREPDSSSKRKALSRISHYCLVGKSDGRRIEEKGGFTFLLYQF